MDIEVENAAFKLANVPLAAVWQKPGMDGMSVALGGRRGIALNIMR